ncbi:MAG: L-seryl-tRNA(Sec) selenium transferase [Chloroflexi bacterium]|nr:L-seryl-tRNA(Sec) selenium transferase [Chloroflexota bacterium]MDA1220233.1 L-seryl-tRNA(Sec) selenium transferase [Chloroflexota bacterium]
MQFRNLPSVDAVLSDPTLTEMLTIYRRDWVVDLARQRLDQARQSIRQGGEAPAADEVAASVGRDISAMLEPSPQRVINATGVIIHTNLGRAPLSKAASEAAVMAAQGYSDLELDVTTGRRGSRQAHLQSLVRALTGAEAALVVNNNAAALLLGLSALATGREVIVSRGEAVEIGGGFRIPDVLKQSGATLVDVGTTNRTYIRDYEDAVTDQTGAFVKAHSSNFRIEGFTAFVEPEEMVELGQRRGIPVLHDVGSGCLLNSEKYGLAHEPTPQESVAAGVGLTFFSGDKLLGGPQAGIIVGEKGLVQKLERHPLARAIRIDKLSLASLTATLVHYLRQEAEQEIPIWRMISTPPEAVKQRAKSWQTTLEAPGTVVPSKSAIGGGSLPGETLPSWALALSCAGIEGGAEEVMRRLRSGDPPVIARIEVDQVLLDPRTVLPDDDAALLRGLASALST